MMANPELGAVEWEIPDGTPLRIPYPLQETLKEYESKLKNRLNYYGG